MKTIPDFQLGLGHIVYALAKIDGRIQSEEMMLVKSLLAEQPQNELALFAFNLLKECAWSGGHKHFAFAQFAFNLLKECDTPVEEAYDFAIRRFISSRKMLDEPIKKEYVAILLRVAEAYDGVSRSERELIQRFRRDLRRL